MQIQVQSYTLEELPLVQPDQGLHLGPVLGQFQGDVCALCSRVPYGSLHVPFRLCKAQQFIPKPDWFALDELHECLAFVMQ